MAWEECKTKRFPGKNQNYIRAFSLSGCNLLFCLIKKGFGPFGLSGFSDLVGIPARAVVMKGDEPIDSFFPF
jgi:hypothetical protein